MSLELVYTSAPRGLNAASSGFCTVAATGGISRQVRGKLEGLSGYQFHFDLSDPQANLNPVNFAHTRVRVGADTLSVLSRIAFCGADYSGRTNKIAHHVLLEHGEQMPSGPAWMMMAMARGVFVADWKGDPKHMPKRAIPTVLSDEPRPIEPATTWETMTGDAGWGGALAQAFRKNPKVPAFVIFKPGQELLPLFEESLALLPPEERWQVGFATYYTTLPARCQYHWRGVLAGSPASREIARFPNATVVDLTAPLAPAEESLFAEAARTGQVLAPVKAAARPKVRVVDRFRAPVKAGGESSREPPYARELSSGGPVDEAFAGTSPARGVSSRRRSRLVPALVAAVVLLATYSVYVSFYGPVWSPRQAPSAAPAEPKAPGEPKSGESSESGASEPAEETAVKSTVAETSVSKTPQEGAAAAPAEGDAPSEGATAPGTGKPPSSRKPEPAAPAVAQQPDSEPKSPGSKTPEKPEPPPQPPEEKGKTPKEEDAKAAAREEVPKPGADKPGLEDEPRPQKKPLPRLASSPANREELVEDHKYVPKWLPPVKADKHSALRWKVGRVSGFAQLPRGLTSGGKGLRAYIAPNDSAEMSISSQAQIAGEPLLTCVLAESNGERELVCTVSAQARKKQAAIIKHIVVEVVDREGMRILSCPLGEPSIQRRSVTLGYSSTGKPTTEDSVLLKYPLPQQALKLSTKATPDLDVTLETDGLRPKLVVQLKDPPDIIDIMRPKWGVRDRMLEDYNRKSKTYSNAEKGIQTEQAKVNQMPSSRNKEELAKNQRQRKVDAARAKLRSLKKELEGIKKRLDDKKPEVDKATAKAALLIAGLQERLTKAGPIRVRDPWGRVVAEVELGFDPCKPENVKGPK